MKKKNWEGLAALAYAGLFGYGLWAKLRHFEDYRLQLEQSPAPAWMVPLLVWGVPILEFLVMVLLVRRRWLPYGMAAGLLLLLCFSGWLVLVIWEGAPSCACGGWLQDLRPGWHIVLNIAFAAIGLPSSWPAFLRLKNTLNTFLHAKRRRHPATG